MCQDRGRWLNATDEGAAHMQVTTIGLDIAKRVFQAHGVDKAGKAVLRRKLQRPEVLAFFKGLSPCLVGIEACGTAHHWAREIQALVGHCTLSPADYSCALTSFGIGYDRRSQDGSDGFVCTAAADILTRNEGALSSNMCTTKSLPFSQA